MKLQEALAQVAGTSRGICRGVEVSDGHFPYESPEDMSYELGDLSSDDWFVEPEVVAQSFTVEDLKSAWETARSGMVAVKSAEQSKLFQNLKAALFGG